MPVLIVDTNAPRVVIVKDVGNVGAVRARNSAVIVPDQGAQVGNALDNTRVVNVASTGMQGINGATTAALAVPTLLSTGETFTVPANKQALFTIPIDIGLGTLDVTGVLVEVS